MSLGELKEAALKEFLEAWHKLSLYGVTVCDARNGEPMYPNDVSFETK
jgi:hypothetical protein